MSETLSAVGAGAAVQARACIGGLVYSLRLAIAGNPNCGKTTVFNALTGAHQHVGNYSGVTVEKKEGYIRYEGQEVILVDLPGAYSLSAYSQEEIVARDVLLDGTVQAVINVVDAGILERGLLLTVQLREMGLPVVIACNMMDEAEAAGICIDFSRLEAMLGVRAVPTVGTTGKGLREALAAARELVRQKERSDGPEAPQPAARALYLGYGPLLDPVLEGMEKRIGQSRALAASAYAHCAPRWLALTLLQDDAAATATVRAADPDAAADLARMARQAQEELQRSGEDAESLIADGHSLFVRQTAAACVRKTGHRHRLGQAGPHPDPRRMGRAHHAGRALRHVSDYHRARRLPSGLA